MEALHSLEISITLWLQALGDWLILPMNVLSFFGQEQFYLLLLPMVYWCFDATIGLRLGAIFLLMQFSNTWLKILIRQPRPFWLNQQIQAHAVETSFGFPSGHSQSAVGIWGFLGKQYQRRSITIGVIILIILIGLSRLYLGVHFLSDVVGGWLIGSLLLWLFAKCERRISIWIEKIGYSFQIWLATGSSLAILLISLLIINLYAGWDIPADWTSIASQNAPETVLEPLSLEGIFTIAGTWLGFFLGAAWTWHHFGKPASATKPMHRFWRYLFGAAGVLVLWSGLGSIFSGVEGIPGFILRYLRYTLIGLWVSALAPLLFLRLGIGGYEKTEPRLRLTEKSL